jgi:histidyl-tRNA synthetase
VTPQTLRGFRDYPPALMLPREHLLDVARRVYRAHGFAPIDTPALEYTEVLLAKVEPGAEIGRQLYRFRDQGDRDVALRFDLTVPFARFAATHIGELGVPFKRYHFGTVWRGESAQKGRYREFMQCDFDTIGTTSNAADVEVALVIHDLFVALGFSRFELRVNNRLVLNGLLEELGLANKAVPVLRTLDKLAKVGRAGVVAELTATDADRAGLTAEQAEQIVRLAETTGTNAEILARLESEFGRNAQAQRGIANLRELVNVATLVGVPSERLKIDVAICRGLDYYTGTIYETFLTDLPSIGSVCSGGRYDNLASSYTRQALPGVGASLGLDRLLAAMEELHLLPKTSTPAPVFVAQFDPQRLGDYHRLASELRTAGLGTEVFTDGKKIGQQLQYAEKRGFRVAIIAGENEFAQGVVKVKDLAARTEQTVPRTEVIAVVRKVLGG